jgi:CheY-like chemotaxis protein
VEADNGKDALDKVRASIEAGCPFDGILMDSAMPIMSGPLATKAIRQLGFKGKIFGVTGNAMQHDIDDFLAHGADAVRIKPVPTEEFGVLVEEMRQWHLSCKEV